ncbi:hypothetical protein [Spirillospora sp. NBC_01491]|uniref:hypothetical protein n=1 Tax=Spirillospora sp. NBC_01491 TaxID=2976007 RepID=UPI002E30DE5D|nr:hypothetical protein [Spirillospora sp. NBC_01491]
MNGYLIITTTNPSKGSGPVKHHLELGDARMVMDAPTWGLNITKELFSGTFPTPNLTVEGTTTRPRHRFAFHAEFAYRPNERLDSARVPYGFHFTYGAIRLAAPPPGHAWVREIRGDVHDLMRVWMDGEAEFIRAEQFAARAVGAVDQAAARMRDRGGW